MGKIIGVSEVNFYSNPFIATIKTKKAYIIENDKKGLNINFRVKVHFKDPYYGSLL